MADSARGVRALLRDSLGYGLGNAAVRATSIVLVPIFTRALAPTEFAVLDLLTAASVVISMIVAIGLDSAVWRYYYEATDEEQRRVVVATALLLQAVVAIVAVLCMIPAAGRLSWLLTGYNNRSGEVLLAVGSTPFLVAMGTVNVVLRTQFRVRTYNVFALSQFLTVAICDVVALRILSGRAASVLAGSLVAYALLFGFGLVLIRKDLVVAWSAKTAKDLLRFGYPLVPAALGIWSLPLVGRYVVAHDIGLVGAAEMAVAAKVAAVLSLLYGAFQAAWGPFALSIMRRPDARATYSRVLTYALVAGAGLATIVSVLARPIIGVIATSRYEGAAHIVVWLSFGSLFATVYYITIIGAMIHKRPEVVTISIAVASAVNVLAALALTPWLGIDGAAVAIFVGQGLSAVLPLIIPRRIYVSGFDVQGIFWTPFASFGLAIAGAYLSLAVGWQDIAIRIVLVSAQALILIWWMRQVGLTRVVHTGLSWLRPAVRTG